MLVSRPLGKNKYFIPEIYLEEAGSCGESLSSSMLFIILYFMTYTEHIEQAKGPRYALLQITDSNALVHFSQGCEWYGQNLRACIPIFIPNN